MTDIMKALASLAADWAPLRQRNTKTVRADGHQVICTDLAVEKLSLNTVRNAALIAFHLHMHTATRLAVPVTRPKSSRRWRGGSASR
jgi:hypothetical protein